MINYSKLMFAHNNQSWKSEQGKKSVGLPTIRETMAFCGYFNQMDCQNGSVCGEMSIHECAIDINVGITRYDNWNESIKM